MPAREAERGSAVAEFTMVTALLMVLVVGVLQVALALHVRNSLVQSAVEGARYGARADVDPGAAVPRTRALITGFASARYAQDVSATLTSDGGVQVVQVTVRAPLPVIGTLGPGGLLTVSGRAYREGQTS
ncbi:TadE/TadG family type IV pilus assembly protein [Arsenicicoccus dermatophilus]|uniref:TadE/TadG family type IV pilus assembly protein n=1 Tax=Arsenicicoccus dermatophilus TaxID=1076331 RepID=UPI0039172D14